MEQHDGQTTVRVQVRADGFRRTMYANRVHIETVGPNNRLVTFGLISGGGYLLDNYAFVMVESDIVAARERLSTYLTKIDDVQSPAHDTWAPPPDRGHVDAVRILQMSRGGDSAEILCCSFAVMPFAIPRGGKKKPEGGSLCDQLALITCETSLQRQLICLLYENFHA